jgi:hypothetical protein
MKNPTEIADTPPLKTCIFILSASGRIKQSICTFIVLFFLVAVTGCGNYIKTYADYDRNINFSGFKTYAWLNNHQPHAPTPFDNDIIENNIKNYAEHELANRGYVADADNPDVLIEVKLSNQNKINTTNTPVYSTYPNSYFYYNQNNYRWNPHGYTQPYQIGNRVTRTEFVRATITINVIKRDANQLIWTGTAEDDIYDLQNKDKDLHPAIDKIMQRYPIRPFTKK